jgi:hypothetical protein
MAKKDRFKQMQKEGGGALSSFQEIVENAKTVAAIEQQAHGQQSPKIEGQNDAHAGADSMNGKPSATDGGVGTLSYEPPRFMRLPNPQLPINIYNLVSNYCNSFSNMTRQDFVELAIIEKLHNDSLMTDDEFNTRRDEIRNRPPRGHRKNTKNQTSK